MDPKIVQPLESTNTNNNSDAVNGVIWDVAINRSSILYHKHISTESKGFSDGWGYRSEKTELDVYADTMLMVGDFDKLLTKDPKNSPIAHFCGIGKWDNVAFTKVGSGGLCQKGDYDYANQIRTATVGGSKLDKLFVGGSFW